MSGVEGLAGATLQPMDTHISDGLRGRGFRGGLLAQNPPRHIRAQLLAAHLPARRLFNRRAALSWHLAEPLAPLIDCRRRHSEDACHACLATKDHAGLRDGGSRCIHVSTVAVLHDFCKAMLNDSVGSIAPMTREWTTDEEAKRLAARFVGVNQAAFARQFNVPGGASMVSQHIKGRRPMNMDAALAYMKGFGVTLAEISPRLAAQMSKALRELDESEQGPRSFAPAPTPQQTAGPPADPRGDFSDKPKFTASDWATLTAVRAVFTPEQIEHIKAQAMVKLEESAALIRRQQTEAISKQKGKVRGNSLFADFDDVPAANKKAGET